MRIDFGIAQDRGHAIFKALGDEVLQPFRLLVHFVPGVLQNVVQEQLQQTMVPDQLPRAAFAGRGEADAAVLFIDAPGRGAAPRASGACR